MQPQQPYGDSMNPPADLSRNRLQGTFWDRQLRARIGQDLRSIFETSLNEPLPERLSHLLHKMEVGVRPDPSGSVRDGQPRRGTADL